MSAMKRDKTLVKQILVDTVTMLCRNGLDFSHDLCIQGVIGITIDNSDALIIHMNKSVTRRDSNSKNGQALVSDAEENQPTNSFVGLPSESSIMNSALARQVSLRSTEGSSSPNRKKRRMKQRSSSPVLIDHADAKKEINNDEILVGLSDCDEASIGPIIPGTADDSDLFNQSEKRMKRSCSESVSERGSSQVDGLTALQQLQEAIARNDPGRIQAHKQEQDDIILRSAGRTDSFLSGDENQEFPEFPLTSDEKPCFADDLDELDNSIVKQECGGEETDGERYDGNDEEGGWVGYEPDEPLMGKRRNVAGRSHVENDPLTGGDLSKDFDADPGETSPTFDSSGPYMGGSRSGRTQLTPSAGWLVSGGRGRGASFQVTARFVCDYEGCGASFSNKHNLQRHQTHKHGRERNYRRKRFIPADQIGSELYGGMYEGAEGGSYTGEESYLDEGSMARDGPLERQRDQLSDTSLIEQSNDNSMSEDSSNHAML